MRVIWNILKNMMIVCLVLILSFNIYSLYQRNVKHERFPMAFGYGYAVIASGSMEPALSWGDLVVVQKQAHYQKDQVITFIQEGDTRATTHRIVEQTENQFVTQGDANNTEDPPIVSKQIFGKVVLTIPLVGYGIRFVGSPLGMLLVIGLFLAMFYFDSRKK